MNHKIIFNGQEYNSPEEMPFDMRQAYEAAMNMLAQRNSSANSPKVNINVKTNVRFVYQGKTYNSPDEMPPEILAAYNKAMEQIDKDHNSVPDFMEGKGGQPVKTTYKVNTNSNITPSAPLTSSTQTPSVITPEGSSTRWLIFVVAIIALLACAVIYIYLR
jgi:hypothetical protein